MKTNNASFVNHFITHKGDEDVKTRLELPATWMKELWKDAGVSCESRS